MTRIRRTGFVALLAIGVLLWSGPSYGEEDNVTTADIAGTWTIVTSVCTGTITLEQTGETITGTGQEAHGMSCKIVGTVSGTNVTLTTIATVGPSRVMIGGVDGNHMSGTMTEGDWSGPWDGTREAE